MLFCTCLKVYSCEQTGKFMGVAVATTDINIWVFEMMDYLKERLKIGLFSFFNSI